MHRREENSVRVTNLSEDTREEDLRVSSSCQRWRRVKGFAKGWRLVKACTCHNLRVQGCNLRQCTKACTRNASRMTRLCAYVDSCECSCDWCHAHALTELLTPGELTMVQELFSPFGPISRIYIDYDRETGEARGFAFVNFMYKCVQRCHVATLTAVPSVPAPFRTGPLLRVRAGVTDLCRLRSRDGPAPRLCLCQLSVQALLGPHMHAWSPTSISERLLRCCALANMCYACPVVKRCY